MPPQSTLIRATLQGPSSYTALTGARIVSGDSITSTLSRAQMVTGGSISVDAGMPVTVDPMTVTPLLGTAAGAPDSVTWVLLSSTNTAVTSVNLVPAAPGSLVTSYIAPATVNGTVLTWRITATKAGQASVTDTVVHTIKNHAGPWVWGSAGMSNKKPVKMTAVYSDDVTTERPSPVTVTGATATAVFTPAITTGAADNFTNLQAAIDAANTAGGGVVPIPPGTYLISRRVILKTGVTLQGAGVDSTILKATTGFNTQTGPFGGKPLITTNGWSNCTIRNITLDQSGDTLDGNQTGRLNEYLLDIRFSTNVLAEYVRTKNPFTYSIVSANSSQVLIRHCETSVTSSGVYNQLDGIHILNSDHVAVMYCDVDQGAVASSDGDDGLVARTLSNGSCHDLWYLNNRVRCGSNGHLMQFATDSATSTIYNVVVDSNEFYGSPRPVMAGFYSATNAVINNIAISNNDFHDNTNAVSMIGGTAMTNIQITNNRAHATGTFAVAAGTGNAVSGTISY